MQLCICTWIYASFFIQFFDIVNIFVRNGVWKWAIYGFSAFYARNSRPVAKGWPGGPAPPSSAKFRNCQNDLFYWKIFSASMYFVHFFKVRPPARARDKKKSFWNFGPPPPIHGSRYGPELLQGFLTHTNKTYITWKPLMSSMLWYP